MLRSLLSDHQIASMIDVISKLTPEQLAQKAPFSPTNTPSETVASLVATFLFHDACDVGQTGILRRLIGSPPVDY